jgi:hypothetical protein
MRAIRDWLEDRRYRRGLGGKFQRIDELLAVVCNRAEPYGARREALIQLVNLDEDGELTSIALEDGEYTEEDERAYDELLDDVDPFWTSEHGNVSITGLKDEFKRP